MKAVITVTGRDTVGIIAGVSGICAEHGVNICDITQSVIGDYFAMIMLVELDGLRVDFAAFTDELKRAGESSGVDIRVMHEDIFNTMHKI